MNPQPTTFVLKSPREFIIQYSKYCYTPSKTANQFINELIQGRIICQDKPLTPYQREIPGNFRFQAVVKSTCLQPTLHSHHPNKKHALQAVSARVVAYLMKEAAREDLTVLDLTCQPHPQGLPRLTLSKED
jgi:hypothetical protein